MSNSKNMRLARNRLLTLVGFLAALWGIQALNDAMGYDLNILFGLIPREVVGVDGILGMPFLHASYEHLISNTVPLALMGGLIAVTATRALFLVNGIIVGVGGALVWLFGSSAIHIGASGLVFGWFGFLVVRGFVDRSPTTVATSVFIGLVYGSILWGVIPGQEGISWEAHLFGAIAGVLATFLVRSNVHAPRLRDVEKS